MKTLLKNTASAAALAAAALWPASAGAEPPVGEFATPEQLAQLWKPLPLPGLQEQIQDAHVNGKNCVWKNVSPGFVNVIYDLVVRNGVITFVLDGGGVVQSTDGGKTWKQISHGLSGEGGFNSFDISPADPKIIVCAGSYLDHTLDGGKTWAPLNEKALPPYSLGKKIMFGRVRFNGDGSRVFSALGSFGHDLEPRFRWAYRYEEKMKEFYPYKVVYVGDAAGANVKALELGESEFAGIRTIYAHPQNPNVVYFSFADSTLFVTRNAKEDAPTFTQLEVPGMEGYEIIDINASPENNGQLLLTLLPKEAKAPSKVLLAKDSGSARLECSEVPFNDQNGKPVLNPSQHKIVTAQWNPRRKDQVFVGAIANNTTFVSDDGMKTFRKIPFPLNMQADELGEYNSTISFYGQISWFAFDRKSDLAVTWSPIGGFSSTDQFKTWTPLLMAYDEKTKLYGNKGAGFAECAVNIAIRKHNTYMVTNDHGVFRSNGADVTQWRRISKNPGIPRNPDGSLWTYMFWPMAVSDDEKYIYISADERPTYSNKSVRLVRSKDQGETWEDVTAHLNQGPVLSFMGESYGVKHGQLVKIIFDSSNSDHQWVLFSNHLFYSKDGGETFTEQDSPLFVKDNKSYFNQLVFDAGHKTLYLGNRFSFTNGEGLIRSRDYGQTWEPVNLPLGPNPVFNVTASGKLVLSLSAGRLAVVPFDKIDGGKIEPDMIKFPKGEAKEAEKFARFNPIYCDGEDILTFYGRRIDNYSDAMGPLLSRDGGETFQWIVYNLPCREPLNAEIRDGKIMIGNRGVYFWDYKQAPAR